MRLTHPILDIETDHLELRDLFKPIQFYRDGVLFDVAVVLTGTHPFKIMRVVVPV